MSAFDRSMMSDIASSHVAGSSLPWRRMSGVVRRSALAFASQPYMPFGPRRPWFTRSPARPRTPTICPPATPTSMPHPSEHSTHTDWTHRSGVAVVRSSTRTGHAPVCGVRGPQTSAIASRVWEAVTLLLLLLEALELLLDAGEAGLHLVLAVLGLVAALVDQVGRRHDQHQALEQLRLPVLERPLAEVHDVAAIAEHGRRLALGRLVGDVLPPAED